MANKKKREEDWGRAKRLCRLNVETVRMARELGLNPRKLIKNIPGKSQPWKAPVHVWIRDLYEKMQAKAARRRHEKRVAQAGCTGNTPPAISCPTGPPPSPSTPSFPRWEPPDRNKAKMPPNVTNPQLEDELDEFDEESWRDEEPSKAAIEDSNDEVPF